MDFIRPSRVRTVRILDSTHHSNSNENMPGTSNRTVRKRNDKLRREELGMEKFDLRTFAASEAGKAQAQVIADRQKAKQERMRARRSHALSVAETRRKGEARKAALADIDG